MTGASHPGGRRAPVVSPGATDARLRRLNGVPAVAYGPSPDGTRGVDESASLDEYFHVDRSRVLSAFGYLATSQSG